jgi:hypothetical protein
VKQLYGSPRPTHPPQELALRSRHGAATSRPVAEQSVELFRHGGPAPRDPSADRQPRRESVDLDFADLFTWARFRHRDCRTLTVTDVVRWVAWLRLPGLARQGRIGVLPSFERVVVSDPAARELAAVSAFYGLHGPTLLADRRGLVLPRPTTCGPYRTGARTTRTMGDL